MAAADVGAGHDELGVPMTILSTRTIPATVAALFGLTGLARAQTAEVEAVEQVAAPPFVRGLLSSSALFYSESSAGPAAPGNRQASPEDLAFADVRARLEAGNLASGRWGGLGDFRLRVTRDDLSARGFTGGGEYHLREAHVDRRGDRVDIAAGRLVLRDVDAIRVDGAALRLRTAGAWNYGAFAGLYPNPLSRSLDTDYERGPERGLPAAGGVWAAYAGARSHGAFGLAGVSPRDPATADHPARVFASSHGYHQASDRLDLFHYVVVDLAGPSGRQLLSAQLGASWRAGQMVRVEAGFAHMSTDAVEIYVRDLLETPDPSPETGAPPQNNLALVRMASDEGRLGAVLSLPARVDLHGQVRVRRREALTDAELPMEIAALAPDTQLDLSGGVRQRDSLFGLDLAATAVAIRGARTASTFAALRARRDLWTGRLSAELEAGAVDYADRCGDSDPTCTGDLDGRTWRAGGQLIAMPARGWLFLVDYRFAWNTADRAGQAQPAIRSHAAFTRLQRSF
jgi:hypothetical protein